MPLWMKTELPWFSACFLREKPYWEESAHQAARFRESSPKKAVAEGGEALPEGESFRHWKAVLFPSWSDDPARSRSGPRRDMASRASDQNHSMTESDQGSGKPSEDAFGTAVFRGRNCCVVIEGNVHTILGAILGETPGKVSLPARR